MTQCSLNAAHIIVCDKSKSQKSKLSIKLIRIVILLKMELKCAVKDYNWGKYGMDSIVASLMASANTDFVVDKQKTYAELWMGTHENVLSVNKALSIQVHPNKEKAKELHTLYSNIYKDANHKPELAIALTHFEALCGFRPIKEIKDYLQNIPELHVVIGETNISLLLGATDSMINDILRQCFYTLMTCTPNEVARQLEHLINRLHNKDDSYKQWIKADLLKRLYTDYPGDVGCFTIYLFNYVILQPGEAIYIGPNVPHAYLFGDCIECMACSDNVIRAGLTSKPKDVKTLIEILSFDCESASNKKIESFREDEFTEIFRPPVLEFAVAKIILLPGRSVHNLKSRNSASLLLVMSGEIEVSSKIFPRGTVMFISANDTVEIKYSCSDPILMFQAFSNV
ncbi:mannose-6-phosphate isomerase isoform X2 [Pseudomyrmex gracilis]|uniref:mannose-6-phosphate isomerase isoform X2 n=1 Tax=Pseudomyrmex gracilis TaxID=219809 RepID=UPI000995726C|nr:mannose-6-phosphate isomerase isoform X2 [Pseudomyrmex gracilis]